MTQARDLADGKFDTDTLVVDAANNRVGVGTASPGHPLAITASGATSTFSVNPSSNLTVIGTAQSSATNSDLYIDTKGTGSHIFRYNAGGAEIARFTSSGLAIGGTGAANTLDDYEEGTFTPFAEGNTTAGTGTYLYQVGSYIKVGSLVQFQLNMQWSSHSGSGVVLIKGLPFTSKNTTNLFSIGSMYASGLPIASNHRAMPFMVANRTYFNVNQENGSGGASSVNIDSAAQILLTGVYRTDS